MLLADRIDVPDHTAALLFDLDGVLIDSLSLDYEIVNNLVKSESASAIDVPRQVIRQLFPLDIPNFWLKITEVCGLGFTPDVVERLSGEHESLRRDAVFALHEGVVEIIAAAKEMSIPIAVVSNNPQVQIEKILDNLGLAVNVIVGNDEPGLAKKPAPDTYVRAAEQLGVNPARCVAVEDSPLGVEAASGAGCYTVAVATGAGSFDELSENSFVSCCYKSFQQRSVRLGRDGVTSKVLDTPNEFVSHMVEHIAWRLGCSINLVWTNDDWRELGYALGREIKALSIRLQQASAIGMIDDGSAEIRITTEEQGVVTFSASQQVDLDWFLSARAEQLANGRPLVFLLEGISRGSETGIDVLVASFEDPHHTWEGIFRGVGISFDKMINEYPAIEDEADDNVVGASGNTPVSLRRSFDRVVERGWNVLDASTSSARVERRTAESVVSVGLRLGSPFVECEFDVADTINVAGIKDLLVEFAEGARLRLDIRFEATRLNSSHVVTEDIGMTLGRALRFIAVERIDKLGIQGAGSSVNAGAGDLDPIRVGVSMEGRKFWKYVPLTQSYGDFRKSFLIGHTLPNGIFSEDLDDFVDGFAGGMESSVVVHFDDGADPLRGWPILFRNLGKAVAGLLSPNPYRRSLTAGVKATLA